MLNELAPSPSQQDRPSHGLASLWDMLRFYAEAFVQMMQELTHLNTIINSKNIDSIAPSVAEQYFGSLLDTLEKMLIILQMPVSIAQVRRFKTAIEYHESDATNISRDELTSLIADLSHRVRDELSARFLFSVPYHAEFLLEDAQPFGSDVEKGFPAASYDIREAGKCLALRLPTACVFHLMRVVDSGLVAVLKCLQIAMPRKGADRSWGNLLKLIKAEIDARDNMGHNSPWMQSGHKLAFRQMHDSVAALKSWRDPAVHGEAKSTDSEAEHMFAIVRGFMQKVASRLDEDGMPLA